MLPTDFGVGYAIAHPAFYINLYSQRNGSNTKHSNTSINIQAKILILPAYKWLSPFAADV